MKPLGGVFFCGWLRDRETEREEVVLVSAGRCRQSMEASYTHILVSNHFVFM